MVKNLVKNLAILTVACLQSYVLLHLSYGKKVAMVMAVFATGFSHEIAFAIYWLRNYHRRTELNALLYSQRVRLMSMKGKIERERFLQHAKASRRAQRESLV